MIEPTFLSLKKGRTCDECHEELDCGHYVYYCKVTKLKKKLFCYDCEHEKLPFLCGWKFKTIGDHVHQHVHQKHEVKFE